MRLFGPKYDVFISHAVEDKLAIANELSLKLEKEGLKVWYSGKELTVGDTIEKTIHKGLEQSRFGVVILSPTYLTKNWARREFYTLLAREIDNRKIILPVLYNITPEQLASHDLTMAGKFSVSFDKGIDHVMEKLLIAMKTPRTNPWRAATVVFSILVVLASGVWYGWTRKQGLTASSEKTSVERSSIESIVKGRIKWMEASLEQRMRSHIEATNYGEVDQRKIITEYNEFKSFKSYYRNEYEFQNQFRTVRFKKNVEPALGIDFDHFTAANDYGFNSPQRYFASTSRSGSHPVVEYLYVNTQPLTYQIKRKTKIGDKRYHVVVSYKNNIRYCMVTLEYPQTADVPKKAKIQINGFQPVEEYMITEQNGDWSITSIQARESGEL